MLIRTIWMVDEIMPGKRCGSFKFILVPPANALKIVP